MDPDPRYFAIGVVVCLLVLAFTSAVDAALSAIGRRRLNSLQREDPSRAKLIIRLIDEPYRFKAAVLMINAAAIIAATAFTLQATVVLNLGWRLAALFGLLLLILIFSEAIPKAFAVRDPSAAARLLARPMVLVTAVLRPFIAVVDLLVRPIVLMIAGPTGAKAPLMTEEELLLMVNVGEEEGLIDSGERQMIEDIFSFGGTLVREVMIPRMDIIALESSATLDEALASMIDYGHSRVPVYDETVDQIVGILYIKDLLPVLRNSRLDTPIGGLLREPYFVPETLKVSDLLRDLRSRKSHIAIMVDEYGGTAGLATIEDLLEEIVGDIQDESDTGDLPLTVLPDGQIVADARISLDDLNDATGLRLESEDADRLGGLVYELLGRVPQQGDMIEIAGVRITVLSVEGLGPKRLQLTPLQTVVNTGGGGNNDDT
ncbi:MAG: HlyC/CorC family transporter [Roseiflexaceae bacterium]|nr:HlyC/CorC family transporter [Roseiflexaceae bacterium]